MLFAQQPAILAYIFVQQALSNQAIDFFFLEKLLKQKHLQMRVMVIARVDKFTLVAKGIYELSNHFIKNVLLIQQTPRHKKLCFLVIRPENIFFGVI